MLIKIKDKNEIPSSEITSESVYKNRRQFMKGIGAAAAASILAACRPERPPEVASGPPTAVPPTAAPAVEATAADGVIDPTAAPAEPTATPSPTTDELGDPFTSYQDVTNYNNFYEFTTDKNDVAELAKDFQTSPWTVEVGGMVNNPGTYDMNDLLNNFDQEERIYRMRCVEGWSMVIPWQGFPLSKLLDEVEPTSSAKYVRFETLLDKDRMPGQKTPWYRWPYVEGLRLDEAYNDLAILSTGLYGETLLPQNGAPIRLVVPWKYGLKSIKSIVKIELTDEMPQTLWMVAAPNEYGFYSNVNPNVPHPRWSQASERRIGENGRRDTLMFNGYEEQVASLYEGMDLKKNF